MKAFGSLLQKRNLNSSICMKAFGSLLQKRNLNCSICMKAFGWLLQKRMPFGTVNGLNPEIKCACEIVLKSRGGSPLIFSGYGDYTVIIYKLSKSTKRLADPFPPCKSLDENDPNRKSESVRGVFVGSFYRNKEYDQSEFVTREQFNDAMIMCQCHHDSFARCDQYQKFEVKSINDLLSFLHVEYIDNAQIQLHQELQSHVDQDYRKRKSIESIQSNQAFNEDFAKLNRKIMRLKDWAIIEECGNFRSLTCEDDKYFYGFEMTTS
jgi:ribosomal protein L40E